MEYNIKPCLFPAFLSEDVSSINTKLKLKTNLSDSYNFEVQFKQDKLDIPYRTYVETPSMIELASLSNKEPLVFSCFMTRHHDGYIREHYLKNVIKSSEAWIIPYISQLVGEYVIEILFEINSNLDKIERVKYIEFFKDNPDFIIE